MLEVRNWSDVPMEELSPTISRQIVTGGQVMWAQVHLKKGGLVPMHSHHNEQITHVVSGCLRFTFGDGSTVDVNAGEIMVIPPHVEHAAEALENTLDMDCFSPPREDWLSGEDAYLRGNARAGEEG